MNTYDLALWYSSKAKLCRREAEKYFKQFKCPECASLFEESIEFATKAICEFLGENYKKRHDISDALIRLSTKFQEYRKELSRAAWISSRWVGMAQRARNLVRYGNQDAKVPATQIVLRKDTEPIRDDAKEICDLLCRIESKNKFTPPIRLGILNGYVEEDVLEKPCAAYPFVEFGIDDWERRFKGFLINNKSRYIIEKIPVSRIGNDFALVLNPFGEAYPEKDIKKRFSFNIIKDYVADGGVYVNTGGFPFFYAWDVAKGKEQPVVDVRTLVPKSVRIKKGEVIVDQYVSLLNFAGSLLWREFDALTTSDTPEFAGINALKVYQTDKDKKIAGDLASVGGTDQIHEFRALRKETKNVIPLLRTSRPDFREVYPIAALPHRLGYLIIGGMYTKGESEFEKLAVAVDNFCNWIAKKS